MKNKSIADIEAAVRDRMPTLPNEIKTGSLLAIRTVTNLLRAQKFKKSQQDRQLSSTMNDRDGGRATEKQREAEDTAANTSKTLPPQGRQILASLHVLLADDPEFERIYNSSAFDQESLKAMVSDLRSIQTSTTLPRRVVAAETAGSEARPDQRGDTPETAAAAEETMDLGQTSKPL